MRGHLQRTAIRTVGLGMRPFRKEQVVRVCRRTWERNNLAVHMGRRTWEYNSLLWSVINPGADVWKGEQGH
eukprot:3455226-Amphidinium_carterae.1